jgi:hypothetical protein
MPTVAEQQFVLKIQTDTQHWTGKLSFAVQYFSLKEPRVTIELTFQQGS